MILEATAASTGGICMPCQRKIEWKAKQEASAVATADDVERDKLSEAIQAHVENSIGSGCVVKFAAYGSDARGMPISNLDEVAVAGAVQFVRDHDPFWGPGKAYQITTVHDPTWMDVCIIANEMIGVTGDQQHCFLEGFTRLRSEGGINILELDMGS